MRTAGIPIVGLEPSCLLTLRDEALVLGLGERAEDGGRPGRCWSRSSSRARPVQGRFGTLRFKPAGAPILLHGHCHQKAFGAMAPVLEVLRLIPGAAPDLIESSCCGMAGSFGYDVEHEEVSMQMAELSLLPAVRRQPEAIVVADGTSCRHQIADGAQREALHVVRLLASLVDRRSD